HLHWAVPFLFLGDSGSESRFDRVDKLLAFEGRSHDAWRAWGQKDFLNLGSVEWDVVARAYRKGLSFESHTKASIVGCDGEFFSGDIGCVISIHRYHPNPLFLGYQKCSDRH